jgi:hypothetical protein
MVKEHPKNLSLLTSPRGILFAKKQIATTNNGCNTYYYDKRIGMIMWRMYAWHGNYDAMQHIQIKQNRIPTHTYMVQVVLLHDNFKCLLAWKRQGMSELHKIKWSGETIFGNFQLLHMLFIMWDANYHVTTRCKMQTGIWMTYLDSSHFSDPKTYKILFI